MNPQYADLAKEVGKEIFYSLSHDHLSAIDLHEIGELVDGPEPMLKVVWRAKWHDGHSDEFKFICSERAAEQSLEKLHDRMAHRLQRSVFKEDTILCVG